MRRPLILLVLAVALGLASAVLRDRPPGERLAAAAASLQVQVGRASRALAVRAHHALQRDSLDMGAAHVPGEGGLRLYRNDSVVAWTDHAPVSDAALDTARAAHINLPDGIYLHAMATGGTRSVHAVQRLWFRPPFENQYLATHFEPGFSVPHGMVAEQGMGPGSVVRDAAGRVMFRLQWKDDLPAPGGASMAALLLALAAAAAVVGALWRFAARMAGPGWSVALFVAVLGGARLAMLAKGSIGALADLPLFDPSLFASSFLVPSLGDLLINAAILLCMVLFLRHAVQRAGPPANPWPAAAAGLLLVFAGAVLLSGVMAGLVHDGSVALDLFRVQDLDGYSMAALLAIGLLLAAWCLLADALLRWTATSLAPRRWWYTAALVCLACMAFNHWRGQYDLVPVLWPLPALWLVQRMQRRPGMIPALALIAVLALFTAHVLNRQTFKRMAMDREALAETATTREDPVVELLFDEAGKAMARDAALAKWLRSGAPCSSAELDRMVRQPFFGGYWDRYELRFYLVGAGGRPFCSTSPDAAATVDVVEERFEQGVPVGQHGDLRITGRPGESALYMGRLPLGDALLFVELRPRLVTDGLGFPELLLAGRRPSPFKPARFVRARYERGVLTASSGPFVFPVAWQRPVPAEGSHWEAGGYDLLAQGDPRGALVVLGYRIPSGWDHLTTFSFLFLLYCLLAALAAAILLLRKGRLASMGISTKVRLGMVGLAIAGLLLFTFGMRRLTGVRQEQRSSRILDERTRGALAMLRQALHGEDALVPAMGPYLDHLLVRLSDVFFTDLSLYAPDGQLLATSREQVFNAGLLGRRMDPRAFQRLAQQGASSFIHGEHIGSAAFSTAYMPFRNDQGRVLAYLALPYFARQAEVEQERASSYVSLVNLFTLLFLLSAVAAALITQWTTRPLELLRRGLERIRLGAVNEPIGYRGDDELGQLVNVYNRKVAELQESAERLARSERESAWREMAKQVAHEIKNPLTPMKLNIQQFQRTWDPGLPDAKERLDRFSNGLVEQIDALGRIAGEFSDFARMPHAQAQPIDLREVVAASVALFANQPEARVALHGGPALTVHADREHLLRVFNNLIKNALQAIPQGQPGQVEIWLRQENGKAVVEVRDNGTGIAEADRERIFQPSFTTKNSGMGLGLAMVQRMVENAGGRVWFTTGEGKGSSFFVALPLERADGA